MSLYGSGKQELCCDPVLCYTDIYFYCLVTVTNLLTDFLWAVEHCERIVVFGAGQTWI
jgi:hypothetical protein